MFVVTEQERYYGKDAECPKQWNEWLHTANVIPLSLTPDGTNNLLLNQPQSVRNLALQYLLALTPCSLNRNVLKHLCATWESETHSLLAIRICVARLVKI